MISAYDRNRFNRLNFKTNPFPLAATAANLVILLIFAALD